MSERTVAAGGESGEARRGLGLALLSAVLWGVSPVRWPLRSPRWVPVSIQAVRLPLAAGVLWITPWSRGAGARVRRDLRTVGPLLLVIGFLTALGPPVTWVAALKYAGMHRGAPGPVVHVAALRDPHRSRRLRRARERGRWADSARRRRDRAPQPVAGPVRVRSATAWQVATTVPASSVTVIA